ncbi:MAG: hypothetical protein GF405_07130 [Candidatus Eisenbacteria bacterium]|nr:hypothetical protein [Candidatus Eisenbacteria bacterium]
MNDAELWKDQDPEPSEIEKLVERGPFDSAAELELTTYPDPPILVRPLVADPDAEWVAPLRGAIPPGDGQRIGVTAPDPALAAKLAADAAVWFADRGRRAVVIDGCVIAPVLAKPLPEDGDEGLVDAALFGVSTSLAARRTLASGVTVMTAGSYPVSVEAVLGGDDLERVLGSFANDVLVLVVLPVEHVPMAAHALTGIVVAGESPEEVGETADRAGLPVAGTLAATAVVVSTPRAEQTGGLQETAAFEPEEPADEERDLEREEPEPEPSVVGETDRESEGEPPEDDREPSGEDEPGLSVWSAGRSEEARPSAERTAEPDEESAASTGAGTGSREEVDGRSELRLSSSRPQPRPPRRRSRIGIVLPIIVLAAAVGWWLFTGGPLSDSGDAPPARPAGERTAALTDEREDASARSGSMEEQSAATPDTPSGESERRTPAGGPDERAVEQDVTTDDEPSGHAGAPDRADDDARPAPGTASSRGEAVDGTAGRAGEVEAWITPDDEESDEPPLVGPGGRYVVYLSSHRRESSAELGVRRAAERGLETEIIAADLGEEGVWHRLRLPGGYPTLDDARVALDRLNELGYEGAWIEYLRETPGEG